MNAGHTVSRPYRQVGIAGPPSAAEHATELLAEGGVAERIEERIQRRVEVADPRDGGHELRAHPVSADGDHREAHEVRQEAHGTTHVTLRYINVRPSTNSPFYCFRACGWFTLVLLVVLSLICLLRHVLAICDKTIDDKVS